MEKSTHKCEVVRVTPGPHPNADRLEVVEVYGYSVCVGKSEFGPGELGVYIPPDSIVPESEEFRFVWESKGYVADPLSDTTGGPIPEKYRRIKAKVLRGIPSEGLLMPVKAFAELAAGDNGETNYKEGDDVAEVLGVGHYNPPDPATTSGDNEAAPTKATKRRRYPKTLYGWVRFLLRKVGFLRSQQDTTEEISVAIPDYEIDAWQRYKVLLGGTEHLWITEKIHGANGRYVFMNDRMYCGSHYGWKKDTPGSVWWECLRQNPWIEAFCRKYPRFVLYGEVAGTQKLMYGLKKGQYRFFMFDVLDLDRPGPARWLDFDELNNMVREDPTDKCLGEDRIMDHWVPTIGGICPYTSDDLRKICSGKSTVFGANHIREGIVIKTVPAKYDNHYGRVILKLVSPEYLGSKASDDETATS